MQAFVHTSGRQARGEQMQKGACVQQGAPGCPPVHLGHPCVRISGSGREEAVMRVDAAAGSRTAFRPRLSTLATYVYKRQAGKRRRDGSRCMLAYAQAAGRQEAVTRSDAGMWRCHSATTLSGATSRDERGWCFEVCLAAVGNALPNRPRNLQRV